MTRRARPARRSACPEEGQATVECALGLPRVVRLILAVLQTANIVGSTVGTVLNALFQQAIRVGKRVHTETGIGAAGRSLISAAYRRHWKDSMASRGTRR